MNLATTAPQGVDIKGAYNEDYAVQAIVLVMAKGLGKYAGTVDWKSAGAAAVRELISWATKNPTFVCLAIDNGFMESAPTVEGSAAETAIETLQSFGYSKPQRDEVFHRLGGLALLDQYPKTPCDRPRPAPSRFSRVPPSRIARTFKAWFRR